MAHVYVEVRCHKLSCDQQSFELTETVLAVACTGLMEHDSHMSRLHVISL